LLSLERTFAPAAASGVRPGVKKVYVPSPLETGT
jgi:hypothetical protein